MRAIVGSVAVLLGVSGTLTGAACAANFYDSDVSADVRREFADVLLETRARGLSNTLSVVRAFSPAGTASLGFGGISRSGFAVLQTLNLTARASITAGARTSRTTIKGPDPSGRAPLLGPPIVYQSVDPRAGLSYRIADAATLYGHYGEVTRAPSLLELDCADGSACLLGPALLADPPLRQTISHTVQAGLRSTDGGRSNFGWAISVYRSQANFDLVTLASAREGRNIATNVATTQRKGVDLRLKFADGPWHLSASYTYLSATYRFDGRFASPLLAYPGAAGELRVRSGDGIPGIGPHQGRAQADYDVSPAWSVGGDMLLVSSQPFVGADTGRLSGYWVANLRTSLQLTDAISLHCVIGNVLNRRYADYGAFFETGALAAVLPAAHDLRRLALGQPISARVGLLLHW